MPQINVQLPSKIIAPLFTPNRYKVIYGGRGSAKSESTARYLALIAAFTDVHPYFKVSKILCCREHQKSISQSVYSLLEDAIDKMKLRNRFTFAKNSIKSVTGSEFIFAGLRHNIEDIKSMKGITHCWVEEAQTVSELSWKILIPTIREEHSEIIITFNPNEKTDPTYQRFVATPPPDAAVLKINYDDNPFFPEVLKREMEYDKRNDEEAYKHIWLGECRQNSLSQIFYGRYEEKAFTIPNGIQMYYGIDWGFAQDPTVMIECFIFDNCLYICREAYGIGVDFDKLPQMFVSAIPTSRYSKIIADNARPETISYLNKHSFEVRLPDATLTDARFNIKPCQKWNGSVEDGIGYIKKFKRIYISPSCKHTLKEFDLYSYKKDSLTGEITTNIIDKHNHCIDAIRYALEPLIKNKNLEWLKHV